MSRLAIRIDGLGKRYERVRPGQQRPDTLRDALSQAVGRTMRRLARPGRRSDRGVETFWALRDVSLELRQGEVLGLIGANGAGKSTLLKILSRITHPTAGRAEVMGRVGSLLEVGTGFNWELTGRENVYLNGAILGMRRVEIRRKFDEIVAFAEVEAFIDTPIKFYSTGMYMRLAFAVAAFLEPEILIVDEVLAVGDASFQRKCLGTMGAASRQGRTVLFVSHNMLAIEGLSHRVVWLAGGKVLRAGSPKEVVSAYLAEGRTEVMERSWPSPADGDVHLRHARIRPARDAGRVLRITEPVTIDIDVRTSGAAHISPVLNLYNEQDILVFTSSPPDEPDWRSRPTPAGLVRFACTVPADLLNDGLYRVAVILRRDYETVLTEQECLVFTIMDVIDRRAGWFGEWPGVVRPVLDWTTEPLE